MADKNPPVSEDRTIQINFEELTDISIKSGSEQTPSASLKSSKDQIDTLIFSNQTMQSSIKLDSEPESDKCLELDLVYKVNEKMGEGGQGIIHLANDKFLNREVVIKTLKSELQKTSVRNSFINEAKVTAQLDHPSTVPIYSMHSEGDDGLSFSMKRIKGVTLETYLNRVVQIYNSEGVSYHKKKSLSSLDWNTS